MRAVILVGGAAMLSAVAWSRPPRPLEPRPPSLPGAVTRPPDWRSSSLTSTLRSTRRRQGECRALYLDALFEFGREVAIASLKGRSATRTQAAQERMKKLGE